METKTSKENREHEESEDARDAGSEEPDGRWSGSGRKDEDDVEAGGRPEHQRSRCRGPGALRSVWDRAMLSGGGRRVGSEVRRLGVEAPGEQGQLDDVGAAACYWRVTFGI